MLWLGLVERRQHALAVAGRSLLRRHAFNFHKLGIHSSDNPKYHSSISLSGSRTASRVANFHKISRNTVHSEVLYSYFFHPLNRLSIYIIIYVSSTRFSLKIPPHLRGRAGYFPFTFMARSTRAKGQGTSRPFHTFTQPSSPAVAVTASAGSNTPIDPLVTSALSTSTLKAKEAAPTDPESDEEVPVTTAEVEDALSRPPPVNSDYLPLPWNGRLGYVSINVLGSVRESLV
jgi:hypothetical protein